MSAFRGKPEDIGSIRVLLILTRSRRSEPLAITAGLLPPRTVVSLPGPAVSYRRHGVDVSGGNSLVSFYRQRELKDGAPRFIRAGPNPSPVRFDDRTADA